MTHYLHDFSNKIFVKMEPLSKIFANKIGFKKIPGTKVLQNNQLLISSGIPALDHVIGGGIPVGSIFIIEEDKHANYSKVMLKYFLSEGVVSNHPVLLAILDNDPDCFVSQLPSPTNAENQSINSDIENCDSEKDLKIAWRYNNLAPVESAMGPSLQFGHYYDLTKYIEKDVLNKATKHIWKPPKSCDAATNSRVGNDAYEDLMKFICNIIKEDGYSKSNVIGNDKILRIAIGSLASPLWQTFESSTSCNNSENSKHLIKFLYLLRAVVRSANAVVYLTIPSHLFDSPSDILNIRHCVDTSIRLESFAGTNRESDPVLRDYHGLFYLTKISAMNSLVPYVPSTLDLAFKLRRKKFLIEKLHLPPELQDSSEREQDDGASLGCGGSKSKKLDF